jgi:hypothetical protein
MTIVVLQGFDGRLGITGVLCVALCMVGCGEPPRPPAVRPRYVMPPVEQGGGGGFAAIQPGQSVSLALSVSGMRLNDMPISDDQLQPVLTELVSRGVLADAPVTVIIDKDVRVLDRKSLLKRLEDQQIRFELVH